jgi:non-heme chloroperoxidase
MPKTKTNDIATYYEISGEGEPLVFIHGMGQNHNAWASQVEFFSNRYRVITYDVRGHGRTDSSDYQYSIALLAEDLKELLSNLDISNPIVCGLSLGSLIAQEFAIKNPELPRKLILCGAHCHIGVFGSVILGKILVKYITLVNKLTLAFLSTEKYGVLVAKSVVRGKDQKERRNEYARICMDISKKDFLKVMNAAFSYDSVPNLRSIMCDTLIMYGENDRIPKMQAHILSENIQRSKKVEIQNAGRVISYERPDEFNRNLFDFLMNES